MPPVPIAAKRKLPAAVVLLGALTVLGSTLIELTGVGAGVSTEAIPQGRASVDQIDGALWIGLLIRPVLAWLMVTTVSHTRLIAANQG
ncbi:hypothetical protein I1E95_06620 [Synechococcus sp. CBW1107]|jgi:hypothetical protein|uniref:hypothetical protein n=1 Tax=Synechococcus sp. CBW1107 TaxID=2789857 RepID=UPI0018CD3CAC|nr:hypothetical protein [Synechococcus sp. CBW1107]QPN57737.1 hypothetical protein I1E95_06620 [Synechococcus sp. CBW1107]CAK6687015.1 hypothetical protein BBFGKLBO_00128 [Synechococcus sp. CBW1107]